MVEKGHVLPGELIIGADRIPHVRALGAFATGVGSTDMGCPCFGKALVQVPETSHLILMEAWTACVCQDLILTIVGDIGIMAPPTRRVSFAVTLSSTWTSRIG